MTSLLEQIADELEIIPKILKDIETVRCILIDYKNGKVESNSAIEEIANILYVPLD
jgi:O-phosphoseryl-tRNA(Cys) synthetase